MRDRISGAIKRVTPELIYNIVDERTTAILKEQEMDKEKLLGHIKALRDEFTERLSRIENRQEKYQEETRAELRHINQRLDTLMNMLLTLFVERRKEERG